MRVRSAPALLLSLASACASPAESARSTIAIEAIARADLPLVRTRPLLVAGKWARMARDPYAFYRGTVPLFLRDARDASLSIARSRFALDQPLVLGLGDAHPENAGVLWASDATGAIEPNDFDGADRVPYLRDLRRLTVGMALAAWVANVGDEAARAATRARARDIAKAAAAGYRAAMRALSTGAAAERLIDAGGNPNLEDLFKRAARDAASRAELEGLTVLEGSARRLKRGVLASDEPENTLADLPRAALQALPAAIEQYRRSLLAPPPAEFFGVLDAAREFGSGVASWPRVRALILVRGPTDAPEDDVILELKELADSGTAASVPPNVFFTSVEARVLSTARAVWARPDAEPFWGTTTLLGLPVQIKLEAEKNKTLRTSRMVGARGTPEALIGLATRLGALLARVHASRLGTEPSPAAVISARIEADGTAFEDEQADVAVEYAETVKSDWALFRAALADKGPTLGVPFDESDAPRADLRALFGTPPPVQPF